MRKATLALLLLATAGCATPEIATLATMTLTNEQGHVIGRRDIVQNRETRETWSNYTLYTPVANGRGELGIKTMISEFEKTTSLLRGLAISEQLKAEISSLTSRAS